MFYDVLNEAQNKTVSFFSCLYDTWSRNVCQIFAGVSQVLCSLNNYLSYAMEYGTFAIFFKEWEFIFMYSRITLIQHTLVQQEHLWL